MLKGKVIVFKRQHEFQISRRRRTPPPIGCLPSGRFQPVIYILLTNSPLFFKNFFSPPRLLFIYLVTINRKHSPERAAAPARRRVEYLP